MSDPDQSQHIRLVHDLIPGEDFEQYRLTGVVSADRSGVMRLGAGGRGVFLVILMTPSEIGVDEVAALNEAHTRAFISGYEGFEGAAFHAGMRGQRIVEIARWG